MPNPKSRADYDQLTQIAGRFNHQAQASATMTTQLYNTMTVLQNGDWVGQGANAFYAEMQTEVLPSLRRLVVALQLAQQTALDIRDAFRQAEAEATLLLTPQPESPATSTPTPTSTPPPTSTPTSTSTPTRTPEPTSTPIPSPTGTPSVPNTVPTDASTSPPTPPSSEGYLPDWLSDFADTHDSEYDAGRGVATSPLGIIESFVKSLRLSAGAVKAMVSEEWQPVARGIATFERTISGQGWEIKQLIQTEFDLLQKATVIDAVPMTLAERMAQSWAGLMQPSSKTFGELFKDFTKDAFGVTDLGAGASKLAKFAKALPWIGLGIDVGADFLKYYNKDGNPFDDGEFYGSVVKDVLYFGVGGVLAAGVGAIIASAGIPVIIAGAIGAIGVVGATWAADRIPMSDGRPLTDHIVNFFTDTIGNPIGNWIKNLHMPSLPFLGT